MPNLHQQVMEIYGGRQMFASVNPADLEETMMQIIQHVEMATEARLKSEKRKRFVYVRTFTDPLDVQTWVNSISMQTEVVDVKLTMGNQIWVTVTVLEKADKKVV